MIKPNEYHWRVVILLLIKRGVTTKAISKCSGVSLQAVSDYKRGRMRPRKNSATKILELLWSTLIDRGEKHLFRLCLKPEFD